MRRPELRILFGQDTRAPSHAARRFTNDWSVVTAGCSLVAIAMFAYVAPALWRFRYDRFTDDLSQAPSLRHPFGTDNVGYDQLAVVMRGTQQSLRIALGVAIVGIVVGGAWGVVSGYSAGYVDAILMRSADLALAVPVLVIAAVLARGTSGSWGELVLVLGLASAPHVARVTRATVRSAATEQFVEAAVAMGGRPRHVMLRHLLPHAIPVLIISGSLVAASAVLAETALSFLGFGVRAPDTSLGLQIAGAQGTIETRPWLFYIPGAFATAIALSINVLGEGLRDALDPHGLSVDRKLGRDRGPRRGTTSDRRRMRPSSPLR